MDFGSFISRWRFSQPSCETTAYVSSCWMNASASYVGSSTLAWTFVRRFSPASVSRTSASSPFTSFQSFLGDFRIASIMAASALFSFSSARSASISRRASL